jgi:hypothetical protein
VNTLLNLAVFAGAFGMQWGIGLLIDALQAAGASPAVAHRNTFAVLLLIQALAYIWVLSGRKRSRRNAGKP